MSRVQRLNLGLFAYQNIFLSTPPIRAKGISQEGMARNPACAAESHEPLGPFSCYLATYRIIVTGLDQSLVWVLSGLDLNAREILQLVLGIRGLERSTHLDFCT